MKLRFLVIAIFCTTASFAQKGKQVFVSSDVRNFWQAYDKIIGSKDSTTQYNYLDALYLSKASLGLKSLMQVRNYTAQDFINAINTYPKFWASLRPNTTKLSPYFKDIASNIEKLRRLYPSLKPATIYFSIGAFRTNGTIQEDRVLIGAELALADESTIITELPDWRQPFFGEYHPRKNIALLCTHEYVHTQQKELN